MFNIYLPREPYTKENHEWIHPTPLYQHLDQMKLRAQTQQVLQIAREVAISLHSAELVASQRPTINCNGNTPIDRDNYKREQSEKRPNVPVHSYGSSLRNLRSIHLQPR